MWSHFLRDRDHSVFDTFWFTNSITTRVKELPKDNVFVVIDLLDRILKCLDWNT